MARAIDAEKYMELLKEQYLHHKSLGNSQAEKAWQGAIQLLYDMPTLTPPNEPLTLEQLREMDGKPVYVVCASNKSFWALVAGRFVECIKGGYYWKADMNTYGTSWRAYSYPPAHIDREAWEKPCNMCGGKTTLYQHTNTTKLFMNTFGNAATLVTECTACPPYADCCMKDISANSAFKINFCPECGRPLTEEAWAELEKRMGVRG